MAIAARMIPLLFYYHRLNRYSMNALAGALDSDPQLANEPIGLARTAEELKKAAASLLRLHDHVLVAVSMMTPQFEDMRHSLRQMRSDHGDRIIFIAGGPHATARPQEVLEAGVNIVCQGEAELTFPRVVRQLVRQGGFNAVAGASYQQGDGVVIPPEDGPVDLDLFYSFSPQRGMFGPIEITRGCPFACSFCQTAHIFGVRPRHRSIAQIVRQAAALLGWFLCAGDNKEQAVLNKFSAKIPDRLENI